ncbi:hypothetical protein JMJ35_007408 [Cladonia borealis]|uniref:Zn(2)-C6 fungal-type domain-containing protein n=1 Tax=Cladonia borealis TaxID=184061 RepID=A0AA39V3K6_9LECA|nr:hypothetical protein JMJ35_007408 [Cladonia borealis]
MAPIAHATTTASTAPPALSAPPASSAPPAPPQRQSCDRCHKQKLRCTRENNSDGGVCDRCFRKRVQCVYSFSLPKGRPSVYRLPDEPTTSNISGPKSSALEHEPVKHIASDAGADADASTKMNVDAIQVTNPSTNEQSVLAGLMDTSMDMSTGTWPWEDTSSWDDAQIEIDWSSHDLSYVDAVLAAPNAFGNGLDPPSSTHPPYPPSPRHPHAYPHGQLGGGSFEKHDGSNKSNTGKSIGGGSDGTRDMSLDKSMNWPSLVIAQLSQLSTRLSSVRHSSYTLANAAESSSSCCPSGRQIPLIDAAAFETVAAWLALGHDPANMNVHQPAHASAQSHVPYPSPAPETRSRDGHGILHDVFSASHRLLEILRHFQVKNIAEPSSTAPSAFKSSVATSGQSSVHLRPTKGPWSSAPSSGSQQQHSHNTMQIIRHLVMACEALLLEIYMAVLTALQHDAFHGASMNTTALGDIRLVLVVQLCSYLIERQQQAVDLCLAPQSPLSVSGIFPPRLDHSGPQKPVSPGPFMDEADREALSDLKNQVQQRLAHLRQTLRCP